jgi:HEPN domain-containing protein
MTKAEYIEWWQNEALRSWETALFNVSGGQYVFALFAFHLTIEKLLKAAWIKDNQQDFPPRFQDLTSLYNQTDLELPNGWYDYIASINDWNIESRYPDFKLKIYQRTTKEYADMHIEKLSELKEILLKYLE